MTEIYGGLQFGRPENYNERIEKERDCYDLLDELAIEYGRVDHSPADSIEDCEAVEEVIGVHICKNLFLCNRQQTEYYLLMMPGDKPFKTKDVTKQLETARLSFGSPEAMLSLLNLTPGSVSVLGLMYDKGKKVRLLMDRELRDQPFLRCHPCINTSTLKISTSDFIEKLIPRLGHKPTYVTLPREATEAE